MSADPRNEFNAAIARLWEAALRGNVDPADLQLAARALYPPGGERRRKFSDELMLATLARAPTVQAAADELGCSRQAIDKRLRALWAQRLGCNGCHDPSQIPTEKRR